MGSWSEVGTAVKGALRYRSHDESISFIEYKRLNLWLQYTQTVDSDSDCIVEWLMLLRIKTVTSLSTLTADDSDDLTGGKANQFRELKKHDDGSSFHWPTSIIRNIAKRREVRS